jgi:hypothetical protein
MQTIKLPRSSGNYIQQVRQLRTLIDNKLTAFCTKKVVESGLTTKTFSYQFDLMGSRSGGQRKSVQKLRDLIQKAVKKQVPYLEYMEGGDLLKNTTQVQSVQLEMKSPWMVYRMTRGDRIREITPTTPWVKSMTRYLKFLNHKCVRKGIPLNVRMRSMSEEVHPDDIEGYETWYSSGAHQPINVRARITYIARISLVEYYYSPFTDNIDNHDTHTYEEYEQWLEANPDSTYPRHSYYDVDNWIVNSLENRHITVNPGSQKYKAPEKIFLELDSLQKVVKTLSRKASYDVAAFNIGSSEAS